MKVGLTGGIGAGKSTVADLFSQKGAVVIRSDELARLVIEPQTPGFQQVIDRFGKDFVNSEGYIDRAKLAQIVFNDKEQLAKLNAIVHPAVKLDFEEFSPKPLLEHLAKNMAS